MRDEETMRRRIRDVLAVPRIDALIARYFDPAEPFAGSSFDVLGDNPPDALTFDDLLATTLLDVSWRPGAVRRVFASDIAAGLAAIPAGLDLWDAGPDDLRPATAWYNWLVGLSGVGPVAAGKLLARKRPRLVPIHDRVVRQVLAPPRGRFWVTLGGALADPVLRAEIEGIRPAGVDEPGLLRVLDVAIWMRHSGSRNAREARAAAGVPSPAQ